MPAFSDPSLSPAMLGLGKKTFGRDERETRSTVFGTRWNREGMGKEQHRMVGVTVGRVPKGMLEDSTTVGDLVGAKWLICGHTCTWISMLGAPVIY